MAVDQSLTFKIPIPSLASSPGLRTSSGTMLRDLLTLTFIYSTGRDLRTMIYPLSCEIFSFYKLDLSTRGYCQCWPSGSWQSDTVSWRELVL